jgi:hypothetical protein
MSLIKRFFVGLLVLSVLVPGYVSAQSTCEMNGVEVDCDELLQNFTAEFNVDSPVPVAALLSVFFTFLAIGLAIIVVTIAGMWKVFTKAGKPGWAAIIPIYNMIVLLEIIGRPVWWVILMFIPVVNLVISFIIYYELAPAYGKDVGFTLGLFFLPFIFFPILGFGSSTYQGMRLQPVMNNPQ